MDNAIENGNMPAMPHSQVNFSSTGEQLIEIQFEGLTKRERLAIAALESGLCPYNAHKFDEIAAWCNSVADAQLKSWEANNG